MKSDHSLPSNGSLNSDPEEKNRSIHQWVQEHNLEAWDILIETLQRADCRLVREVVVALEESDAERAVPHLLRLLQEEAERADPPFVDNVMRCGTVAYVLGLWNVPTVSSALRHLLCSGSPRVKPYVAVALAHHGDAMALHALVTCLQTTTDRYTQEWLIAQCGWLDDPRIVLCLVEFLHKPLDATGLALRRIALGSLRRIGSTQAIQSYRTALAEEPLELPTQRLIEHLEQSDPKLQREAVFALLDAGLTRRFKWDPQVVGVVIDRLPHLRGPVLFHAVEALGYLGDERAIPVLIDLLPRAHQWPGLRPTTLGALVKLGQTHFVDDLIEVLLEDQDQFCRSRAAYMLGETQEPRAVLALLQALTTEAWQNVRHSIASALGKIGDPAAAEALAGVMNEDEVMRKAASYGLAQIGDARAIGPLVACLAEQEWGTRVKAVHALGELGGALVVEPLLTALQDRDPLVRWEAAEALGKVGDVRAIGPLQRAQHDVHVGVQQAAAQALRKINLVSPIKLDF